MKLTDRQRRYLIELGYLSIYFLIREFAIDPFIEKVKKSHEQTKDQRAIK